MLDVNANGTGNDDEAIFKGEMCDCPGTLVLDDESSIVAEVTIHV